MTGKTVREALQHVAKSPLQEGYDPLETPTWQLVGSVLFDIANSPNAKVRGSMARATKAQGMIADRLVGTRRPGTHPAVKRENTIRFVDLTRGELSQ